MKEYNPAKFEDVIAFLGNVNKAVYGVNPYSHDVHYRDEHGEWNFRKCDNPDCKEAEDHDKI